MSIRREPRSVACGYFPVLSITVAKVLEAMGGYCVLLGIKGVNNVLTYLNELNSRETDLVGAEPYLTEFVVKRSLEFAEERSENSSSLDRLASLDVVDVVEEEAGVGEESQP